MGRPISLAIRQKILADARRGVSKSEIARTYGVGRTSVVRLLAQAEHNTGKMVAADYSSCGKVRLDATHQVFRSVRCLRCWHPQWGAQRIRVEILRLRPKWQVPHARTIHRWLVWNGQVAHAKSRARLPTTDPSAATSSHEIWQVDAKEYVRLADESLHCWLNVVDEYNGMILSPPVFPPQEDLRGGAKTDSAGTHSCFQHAWSTSIPTPG